MGCVTANGSCVMSVWATLTGWHHAQAFWLSQVGPLLEADPQSLAPRGIHIIGISAYLLFVAPVYEALRG